MKAASIINELRKANIKLSVNGSNLEIKSSKGTLTDELVSLIKNSKTALIDYLSQNRNGKYESIPRVSVADFYELSHAQRRLWIINQMDHDRTAYIISGAYVLTGDLNIDFLDQAFARIIERHEILRTIIVTVDGEPRQKIKSPDELSFTIRRSDLRGQHSLKE